MFKAHYNSWSEFLASVNHDISTGYNDPKWSGADSVKHAVSMSTDGVPELEAKVSQFVASIETAPANTIKAFRQVYAEDGCRVDVARYLSGREDCMVSKKRTLKHRPNGRLMKIGVNIAGLCKVETACMEMRGAAICALITQLEAAGYRVQIDICSPQAMSPDRVVTAITTVNIKRFDDQLDFSRLCYCLISPSMFRMLMFAWAQTNYKLAPNDIPQCKHAYGYTSNMPANHGYDLYIPNITSNDKHFQTIDGTHNWLDAQVKRITEQA